MDISILFDGFRKLNYLVEKEKTKINISIIISILNYFNFSLSLKNLIKVNLIKWISKINFYCPPLEVMFQVE